MSNLSELLPTGGGQNAVDFVASGTLSSGQTVVLNSDGTVEAVALGGPSAGTPVVFEEAGITETVSVFDSSSNTVVVVYVDTGNSYSGTAVVGTISGASISFGTPVAFNGSCDWLSATFDSSTNKVIVFYRDNLNSNYGTARVGTVSGTSISFGSEVIFNSANSQEMTSTFDSNSNKTVTLFADAGNSGRSTAVVGTVSGTSISFGSLVVQQSTQTQHASLTFDSNNNKVVAAYRDDNNSFYGTAVVGTVSGTSISFGSEVVFNSANTLDTAITFDSNLNKVVIIYRPPSPYYLTAIVGTVSGTSISFGTAAAANSTNSSELGVTFDSNANKVVTTYRDGGNSNYGTAIVGTVSGTSISFGSPIVFEAANTEYTSPIFDSSSNKTAISYRDSGNSSYGTSVVFETAASNNTDFIGITAEAISNAATGAVNVYGGINEAQTGLTIAADYYVQADGSLVAGATSIPFDISDASFVQSFSVAAQDSIPRDIVFNSDGTKMFILGDAANDVHQYALTTGFDVSTASFVQSFDVSNQGTAPEGLAFNADGTKMFVSDVSADVVNEYSLSTGFDVSTASYTQNFSVSSQDTKPTNIAFNTDGTKMFILGDSGNDVNEYTLSTGFDVSTASFVDSFSVAAQETSPNGLVFNSGGTKMFVVGFISDTVFQYNLTTGFDVSTASYSSISFNVASQDGNPTGIAFNTDGTKMFIVGYQTDSVGEYTTTQTAFITTVLAGQAISATTINMKDLT